MHRIAITLATLFIAVPAFADEGAETFEKKCGSCHGKDGKAANKMGEKLKIKDMTSADFWKDQTDEKMTKAITDGITEKKMPSFKEKLTADQVKAVVKHLNAFKPAK
jgi:mono/diheme cytochrome c family protein